MFSLQAGALATNSPLARFAFPLLVMFVPLLDVTIVSFSRMATGEVISRHGYDHVHHRLQTLGLSDRRVALVLWGLAMVAGFGAVILARIENSYVLMLLPWIVVGAALPTMFMMDLTFESRDPGLLADLPILARSLVAFAYKRRMVETALDAFIVLASFFGAFLIRLDFRITPKIIDQALSAMPAVFIASYAAFVTMRLYRGIWRYLGFSDAVRFALAAIMAGLVLRIFALTGIPSGSGSIDLLFAILLFNLLVLSRASFTILRNAIFSLTPPLQRILILGAGHTGAFAAAEIEANRSGAVLLVGFTDQDSFKWGKLVCGRPVFGPLDALDLIHDRTGFTQIIIAAPLEGSERELVQKFVTRCNIELHQFSIGIERVSGSTMESSASTNTEAGATALLPISASTVLATR
jgi:hypothetical protein